MVKIKILKTFEHSKFNSRLAYPKIKHGLAQTWINLNNWALVPVSLEVSKKHFNPLWNPLQIGEYQNTYLHSPSSVRSMDEWSEDFKNFYVF